MYPNVSIIILNWNGWNDTVECLESLYQINYPNYNVILVDNASSDNSIEKIKEYLNGKIKIESIFFKYSPDNKPISFLEYQKRELEAKKTHKHSLNLPSNKKLILIKNDKNYGFAKGNNIGIKYALNSLNSDYILLLNNDTTLHPDFLDELVKVSKTDPSIAIAGPKIYPYTNGVVQKNKGIIGSKIAFWKGGTPQGLNIKKTTDVDMISGACMLISNHIIQKFGFLDSIYFFGWEDADFCTKVKKSGYRVVGVPEAKILHKIGASYGDHFANNPNILREGVKNQLIFLSRYANGFQKAVSVPFILIQLLFLVFWKSNNLDKVKTKTIFIEKGIKDFIIYRQSYND